MESKFNVLLKLTDSYNAEILSMIGDTVMNHPRQKTEQGQAWTKDLVEDKTKDLFKNLKSKESLTDEQKEEISIRNRQYARRRKVR
ncbi:MAG TPA: hypothetical protein VEP90_23185 [Methylomirabilota bacterium]|nr:hypothetical protein [Methylomirabilota bacterium]